MKIWLIAGIALLAGCESEFDRCMAAEHPRAVRFVGLEEEREAATILKELSRSLQRERKIEAEVDEWEERNPIPKSGRDSPEMKEYWKQQTAYELEVARSFGVEAETYDEWVEQFLNRDYDRFEQYVRPRSRQYRCRLGSSTAECEGFEFVFDNREEGLAEAILANKQAIADMTPEALELAEAACNRNGIYE